MAAAIDRLLDAIPPASGAVVMGTGIVSVGLSLDGQEVLSRIFLGLAAAVWLTLALLLPARARRDRARFRRDLRTPAAFTAVAGTAVLGTRLTIAGWSWAGIVLLVVALAIWLGIIGPVLAAWSVPTVGASFILTVGTESLALLSATLAFEHRAGWLLVASLVPFVLGLAFYAFVARRFDWRQLTIGHGDHWVTGGALAISTMAAGRIAMAADRVNSLDWAAGALEVISIALWGMALLWLPVLLATEASVPRIGYTVRRWSTVFPVGMYAACSFVVGTVASVGWITGFARVWIWVALAVWTLVAFGLARAAGRMLASGAGPDRGRAR